MIRRPPRSTRTDTLCPYTTLFRSALDAGVAFYGRLTGKPDALHPKSPIAIVTDIKAPVLGQYGGLDRGIPVADVDAMRTALQGAGKPAALVRSEEHTSELQTLMRNSSSVFCLKNKLSRMPHNLLLPQ